MNFSKITLFAAAMLAGATAVSATTATGVSSGSLAWGPDSPMSQSYSGNIVVEDDGFQIAVTQGDAYTINGSFLSPNGSLVDQGVLNNLETFNKGDYSGWDDGTVTISGGGTLEYAGTVGSEYYSSTYTLTLGESTGSQSQQNRNAWASLESFLSTGVFTGDLVVGSDTTLNLTGQLVQYVGLYTPLNRDSSSPKYSNIFGEYLGVSSFVLEDYATISFESSRLNMKENPPQNSGFVSENASLALNFLQNVYASANSKIVIGTDSGSVNRIVVNTDTVAVERDYSNGFGLKLVDEISTIGRLAGNGRFFTVGEGAIAFIGQSELNPGNDTTGNTWIEGNRLADIVLGNSVVYVGANPIQPDVNADRQLTDSEVAEIVVDNVFANATAVHLGGWYSDTEITDGGAELDVAGIRTSGYNIAISSLATTYTSVCVYGDQVFNNFQSLWLERSNLLSDPDTSVASYVEPVRFSYRVSGAISIDTGINTEVRVAGGAVLTINQAEGRDGYYRGDIITHVDDISAWSRPEGYWDLDDNGDGLVVKTGAGRIYNTGVSSIGTLSRLRVEEGTWISTVSALAGSDVTLTGTGKLDIIVDTKEEMTSNVSALDPNTELTFSRFVVLENDLTADSLANVTAGGTDELEYRYYIVKAIDYASATVQVSTEQAQFYGTVVVNDGLTLSLGDSESGSNSPSIFSSAAGIVLNGVNPDDERYAEYGSDHRDLLNHWLLEDYDGTSLQYATLEILSGVQLVRNLGGDEDHSAVRIEKGATLVLTKTSDSSLTYNGGFSGNGNLVNLGGDRTIRVDNQGDLFGTLTMLSGTARVIQTVANAGFSGLVLANSTSVSLNDSGTSAKVGALVGESGTTVSFSGDLTVGDMSSATGRTGADGEYLATAKYDRYDKYFTGTSVESVHNSLKTNVESVRGSTATVETTDAYLANPAQLVYTDPENKDVLNGAFSRVFTTTGTDRNGNSVFETMKAGTGGSEVFGSATTVAEWLRTEFSEKRVADFINDASSQLSEQMKSDLTALAATIATGTDGVCTYLDGTNPATANLNYEGWNAIVSAGGLELLKFYHSDDVDFSSMTDSSLYSFIKLFYGDENTYEFILTDRNAQLISGIYGVESVSWRTGSRWDYDKFIDTFGVESTYVSLDENIAEFAGTLMGSGNLIKIGAESLYLTGVNSYTGATLVQGGELYVEWDAIQSTSGITVDSGALLTINGETEYVKDEDGNNTSTPLSTQPLLLNDDARLTGAGTVLKLGDAEVDLNNALLDVADGAADFTGTFVIGEGGLKATVDAVSRSAKNEKEEESNPLNFNIVFSGDAESVGDNGQTVQIDRSFTLAFATTEDSGYVIRDASNETAVELTFAGTVEDVAGNGKFVLDAGRSVQLNGEGGYDEESFLNNVLNVSASKFTVSQIELQNGTLKYTASANTTVKFDALKFVNGGNAELVFDLGTHDVTLSALADGGYVSIGSRNPLKADGSENTDAVRDGSLVVRANVLNETTDTYNTATLTLENTQLSGITSLKLEGGAQLVIESLKDADDNELTEEAIAAANLSAGIELTSLSGAKQTSLELGANRELSLTVATGEVSEFFGSLLGEGTFTFTGGDAVEDDDPEKARAAGKLVIGDKTAKYDSATSNDAFGGTIIFESGVIELDAGENLTLNYKGLSIECDSESVADRTLVKDGAGTVQILSDGDNEIKNSNLLNVDVQAGTLAVSGSLFSSAGTTKLLNTLNIKKGATFRFVDPMNSLDIKALGELSGTGTLAFGESGRGADSDPISVSVNSNVTDSFTGVVYVAQNVTLTLGTDVHEFAAFAGEGTVVVGSGSLTVNVDANEDGSQKFGGTIEGLTNLTVVGDGALVFDAGKTPEGLTTIAIGADSGVEEEKKNGGVGVGAEWDGTIDALGSTSRVLITGISDTAAGAFAGTVNVSDSVENLYLLRDGTLALGENAVSSAFSLKDSAGTQLDLSGDSATPTVTLGNIAGSSLTLTNLSALNAENFELCANAGGADGYGFVFSGASVTSSASGASFFDAAADAEANDTAATWSKDISGEGGIAVTDGAELRLTSSSLSYTGKTFVESGSTLIYGSSGMVSASSKLEVSGTLEGGVTLTAEDADVVFNTGSTFVFNGEGVKFTGTAKFSGNGTLTVVLDDQALNVRGTPLALFEYVGTDTNKTNKNYITFGDDDNPGNISVQVNEDAGLYYYIDRSSDPLQTGKTVIYVATDDLSSVPGVSLHDGLNSSFIAALSELATPERDGALRTDLTDAQRLLAETVIRTPNGALSSLLTNLSPLGYASMVSLPQSGFLNDIAAISSRLEARRYDNYAQFIWETHNDWEFFAQAQGSTLDTDDASDTRTFDMDTYGAVAGADVKLGATTTAGFAVAYDYGKADFHDGGGKVESNDIRATAFLGKVFLEQFYFDAGVQAGFASYDVKRHTALGGTKGDTTGLHAGAFFNVGTLIPLSVSEDEKTSLYLMPYVGLAYSYYNVGSFDESGAATALDTDSFDANSLRASVGASLALKFQLADKGARLNLDFSYTRELLDTETDITSSMPEIGIGKSKFEAPAFAEDVFSVGPRFSLDLDNDKSVYAGYHFEMSTDSDVSHSLVLGFRSRF